MRPRLIIEQKLTPFVNKYKVLAPSGEGASPDLVALAQQKRLAFREKVMFYTDEKRDRLAFTFRAEKVVDVHGRYFVEDANGRLLGMFKKEFVASLLNSTWMLMDAQGQPLLQVKESNQVLAVFRRFGGEIPLIGALVEIVVMLLRYHFVFVDSQTGQTVGEYRKTTLWRDHYELSLDDGTWDKLDWRVYASMGVALDALQSR